MSSIFEIAEEYLNAKNELANLKVLPSNKVDNTIEFKIEEFDKLELKISTFLKKIEPILRKVCILYEGYGMKLSDGYLYVNGVLPRNAIPYDEDDCFEKADMCAIEVSNAIKGAAEESLDISQIKKLCVCHYSLRDILDSIDELKHRVVDPIIFKEKKEKENRTKRIDELEEKISELDQKLKDLSIKSKQKQNLYLNNKLFLGYRRVNCSSEVTNLLKKTYGLKDSAFSQEPIILGLGDHEKNIVFFDNADNPDEQIKPFSEVIQNIYFTNATNFNSQLRVAQVKINDGQNLSSKLIDNVTKEIENKKGKSISISNVIISTSDEKAITNDNENPFEKLLMYKDNNLTDIEEYNEKNTLCLKDYLLVFIDNFPKCINTKERSNAFLKLIHDSKRTGMFFVINGSLDKDMIISYEKTYSEVYNYNASKVFSRKHENTLFIDYQSSEYSLSHFNESVDLVKCITDIYNYNRKLHTFVFREKKEFLGELLNENISYRNNDIGAGISIPIGFTELGETFNFTTDSKNNPFVVVTGNVGSGKTAFLHTLILSGALKYSPDELEYYIVDFKDKAGSADFEQYSYKKDERNLYIPHVKYLSTKASKESAFDILNLINKCASENLQKIRAAGKENFASYNSSPAVKEGKLPKISQKYFIIDEYGTMMLGGEVGKNNSSDANEIKKSLTNILSRIRSSGVGVILSGQRANILDSNTFSYFKSQIVFDLGMNSHDKLLEALNLTPTAYPRDIANEHSRYISNRQGYIIYRKLSTQTCVHTLYSGDIGSEDILCIADVIRKRCGNKYPTKQIIPGTDKFEGADAFLTELVSDRANRVISIPVDDTFRIENEYDLGLKEALYLGITKTTSVPTALKFDEKTPNYLLYANNKKITKVLTNCIVQTIYEQKHNPEQTDYDLTYVSVDFSTNKKLKEEKTKEIQSYMEKYSIVKNNLNIIDDPTNAIIKLLDLSQLCKDRKMAYSGKVAVDTTKPYYLYINKIDWMFDEDYVSSINSASDKPEEAQAKTTEVKKVPLPFDDASLADIFGDEDLDVLVGQMSTNSAVAKESVSKKDSSASLINKGYKKISLLDVNNAIFNLIENGPKYNIYCVFGFNEEKTYKTMSKKISNFKDYKTLIYGSYEMRETNIVSDFGEPSNSCYITNEKAVIRLYDFLTNSSNYWMKLNN